MSLEKLDTLCKERGLTWLLRNDALGYFLHVYLKDGPLTSLYKCYDPEREVLINNAITSLGEDLE